MPTTQLIDVPLDHIHDHPLNAHVVSDRDRGKVANNIRRTGHYPSLIVRELTEASEYWPGEAGHYQILDGHQRRLIFVDLVEDGLSQFETVRCDDWSPLTDEEAAIALATLNSWGGNVPRKRAELLHHITKFTELRDAASILPESDKQIQDALKLLKQPMVDIKRLVEQAQRPTEIYISFVVGGTQKPAIARLTAAAQLLASFYGARVTDVRVNENEAQQTTAVFTFSVEVAAKTIIEEALKKAGTTLPPGADGRNKRGRALEAMASQYLALDIKDQFPLAQVEAELQKQPRRPKKESAVQAQPEG